MKLAKGYETRFWLSQIKVKTSRRYDQVNDPMIRGLVQREQVAGFFRSLEVGEEHLEILKLVNLVRIIRW